MSALVDSLLAFIAVSGFKDSGGSHDSITVLDVHETNAHRISPDSTDGCGRDPHEHATCTDEHDPVVVGDASDCNDRTVASLSTNVPPALASATLWSSRAVDFQKLECPTIEDQLCDIFFELVSQGREGFQQ